MIYDVYKRIQYYSTNGKAAGVSFGEALLKGLAPDKGLYMPDHIPVAGKACAAKICMVNHILKSPLPLPEIFCRDEITDDELLPHCEGCL